jgi:hypothetical protein
MARLSAKTLSSPLQTHHQRVETPRGPIAHETEDSANIIAQDDLHKVVCVHQAGTLKYFLILTVSGALIAGWWIVEGPTFVYRENLLCHILFREW